jgi:uncharacterized membrane protein YbhN (UPF0104 family)
MTTTLHPRSSRATWMALFGVVPDRGLHRRASDITRIILGAILVFAGAIDALSYSPIERSIHSIVNDLPSIFLTMFDIANGGGIVVAVTVVFIVAVSSRRIRFVTAVLAAAGAGALFSFGLQHLIDAPKVVEAATKGLTGYPQYPSLRLTVLAAVFFVASPELTRPSRRLMMTLLVIVSVSATAKTEGYPAGVLGSIALGWAIAAAVHLVLGSPDGVPDTAEVTADLAALGHAVTDLSSSSVQSWGEKAYVGSIDRQRVRVIVIGRDATDAQFLTKVGRFIWYKDSGPTLVLSHQQQIEHRGYTLLLAERAGVAVPSVIASGAIGARRDAVLVLGVQDGPTLAEMAVEDITDDVIDGIWDQLSRLHAAGMAHDGIWSGSFRRTAAGMVFSDLATADADPEPDALLADRVALLTTTADLVDRDRAIAAAERSLGRDGLAELLPLLQLTALPRVNRRSAPGLRKVCADLRSAISERTGVDQPKLVELRRVAPASILIAVFTIFGAYLLIGEFAHVDWATMFDDANWWWVLIVALLAQMPILGISMALLGSVSKALPLRPVIMLEIGTKFTGLAGGGVTTIALIVRFFQKQGLPAAVAVTSSLLNSVASGATQVILLTAALVLGAGNFSFSNGGSGGLSGEILLVAAVVAVITAVAFLIPGLRRRLGGLILPQVRAARSNLAAVLKEPRKGVQMIGGNAIAQIFYALVLWAALHAYGQSLPLLQLIVINSFASILGGIAPVPGGIGVIEAGLIAGFTAAGVPDQAAIAATFTARMWTAYLPPIWGWLSINWMRHRDYV